MTGEDVSPKAWGGKKWAEPPFVHNCAQFRAVAEQRAAEEERPAPADWGPAISRIVSFDNRTWWAVTGEPPEYASPITFCPWCAAELRTANADFPPATNPEELSGAPTSQDAADRLVDEDPSDDRDRRDAAADRLTAETAAVLESLQKPSTSRTPVHRRAPRFALEAVHRLARLASEVDRFLTVEELARRPTLRALVEGAEEFVAAVMEAPSFDEAIRRIEGPATDRDEAHVEKYFDAHDAGFVGSAGYTSPLRRLDAMILEQLFTPEEAATLSNTVCGNENAARALEERGLLLVDRVEDRMGERIAFFQLTPLGMEYVRRFFTVREDG